MGNRPIKLRKSNWRERIDYDALERQKVKFPLLFCGFKFSFCLTLVLDFSLTECVLHKCSTTLRRSQSFQRRVYYTNEPREFVNLMVNMEIFFFFLTETLWIWRFMKWNICSFYSSFLHSNLSLLITSCCWEMSHTHISDVKLNDVNFKEFVGFSRDVFNFVTQTPSGSKFGSPILSLLHHELLSKRERTRILYFGMYPTIVHY